MKQSIYLHKDVVNVLRCFGDLNTVVDRILQEGNEGKFDIMNKPPAPPREGAGRYDITITNEAYLELLEVYSPYSSHISLRRLLYWFVENEMHVELGWPVVAPFVDATSKAYHKKLSNAISELQKAKALVKSDTATKLETICKELKHLMEVGHGA